MFTKVVLVLSWVSVAFAVLASTWWVWYVFLVEYNFLFDVMFTLFTAPVNVAILLLVLIPSSFRYFRTGQRSDMENLLLSGCSFVMVLVETVLLWTVINLHGA